MILTTRQAHLILALIGRVEGSIRPGQFTANETNDLIDSLTRCAGLKENAFGSNLALADRDF